MGFQRGMHGRNLMDWLATKKKHQENIMAILGAESLTFFLKHKNGKWM